MSAHFRGREDAYPRRFESRKTGKSGYAPACANEWVRGICEKPRIKCAECPHRRFLPVTDDVIRWHLTGCDDDGQPFVAAGESVHAAFQGALRPEQQVAAAEMLKYETGVLAATTAFGKTVVAAWLIDQRRVNTLVLVHRRHLLDQWVERLAAFLDLSPKSIGRIGGGRPKPTGVIDVAVIQSLVRKGVVDDCVADCGHVIVDECHHVSAQSFEQVVRRAKARFVLFLSATVTRKDGHHPIIVMQCGPIRHRVDAKAQAAARPFEHIVEIDGGQHLADPVAYRRDRRKDQLLQENGYLVLRFLAEDLAKELDSVLDGILRSLGSRKPSVAPLGLTLVRGSRGS